MEWLQAWRYKMGLEAGTLALITAGLGLGGSAVQAHRTSQAGKKEARDVRVSAQVAQNKAEREKKEGILRKLRRRDRGNGGATRSDVFSRGNVSAPSGAKTLLGQ